MRSKLKIKLSAKHTDSGLNARKKRLYLRIIKNHNAQTTALELSIFVVCFILALIAMQGYIKRSIEGGLRSSADNIGLQYDPAHTSVDFTITSRSDIFTNAVVEQQPNGNLTSTTTVFTNLDEQTRQGTEIVGAY